MINKKAKVLFIFCIVFLSPLFFFPSAQASPLAVELTVDGKLVASPEFRVPFYDELEGETQHLDYKFTFDQNFELEKLIESKGQEHYSIEVQLHALLDNLQNLYPNTRQGRIKISYSASENVKVLSTLQAHALLDEEDTEARIALLVEGLEYEPDNISLNFHYGDALSDAGKIEESVIQLKKVAKLAPENGNIYYSIAYRLYQLNNYKEARHNLTKSLELGETWETYWLLHKIADAEKRENDALTFINKAINLGNDEAYLKSVRAWYLRAIGAPNLAIKDFKRSLEINPNYDWALSGMARSYYDLERYSDAKTYIDIAQNLNSNDLYDLELAANIYDNLELFEQAEKYFKQVLKKDEKYASALNNLGYSYSKQKRYEEAISVFNRAIEIDIADNFIYHNLGVSYFQLGQFSSSREAFLMLSDDDRGVIAEHYLAEIYLKEKNYTVALEWLSKAIDYRAGYVDALHQYQTGKPNFLLETVQKFHQELGSFDDEQQDKISQYVQLLSHELGKE